jgi:hypothetical protein
VSTPISALERKPTDFIREVSPDALNFYAKGLSELYLPEDFRQAHNSYKAKYWKSEDRLRGKFGRFALLDTREEVGQDELEGMLVIGTTIALSGLMESLRHFQLDNMARGEILSQRDLTYPPIQVIGVDYGATSIGLDESGTPQSISVGESSCDFGRADAEGRQKTCELFEQLLGKDIQVINADPEPQEYEQIIE